MTDKHRHQLLFSAMVITVLLSGYTFLNNESEVEIIEVASVMRAGDTRKQNGFVPPPLVTNRPTETSRVFYLPSEDTFEAYSPPKKALPVSVTNIPVRKTIKNMNVAPTTLPPVATTVPVAPPQLPFQFIGKLLGDDEYVVFLSLQNKSLSVKLGDIVEQAYRVDEIKPPLMQLTYLPMNIKQTIMIGEP